MPVKTQPVLNETKTATFGTVVPKRVVIGVILSSSLLITPWLFGGTYLNPVTISLHVLNYLFWALTVTMLHREVRDVFPQYPFGPKESMAGSIIPFSYIIWNFHWVSEMWSRLGLGTLSFKGNSVVVGMLVATASVFCFPDNMDKILQVVPFFSFLVLYSVTWIFTARIRELNRIENSVD